MEVFKAVLSEGSNACDRIAIKADEKSYSYGQLTSSALTISKLFCREDTTNVWFETVSSVVSALDKGSLTGFLFSTFSVGR